MIINPIFAEICQTVVSIALKARAVSIAFFTLMHNAVALRAQFAMVGKAVASFLGMFATDRITK